MATVNATEVIPDLGRMAEAAARDLTVNKIPRGYIFPFAQVFTVPATTNDGTNAILRLLKFPAGAYIWRLRVTPSDMDTGGSPALIYSLLSTDDSDVTKVSLVTGSTNAQAAAGSDAILTAAIGRFVGNQWLSYKVTTNAATAATGTLKIAMEFSIGTINRIKRGIYLGDAEG